MIVAREVPPIGYFLTLPDVPDVLLHYSEALGEVKTGERVEVFLFHDSEDRLAATMRQPYIEEGKVSRLQVADIHPRLGCFLDMGLSRHLLLPVRELPELRELWPQVGDHVFIVPSHDKQGRLLAKAAGEEELAPLMLRAPEDWKNRTLKATVYKPLQIGDFAVVDAGVLGFGAFGFVHESERTRKLRMGEEAEFRVIFVRDDGRVNLSMRPLKQESRSEDAEKLLAVLRERPNGAMPYSDETPADIIQKRFGISKSAFKRALGKLLKDGIVIQEGSWTKLKHHAPAEREE
ncbi:hypothetical protein XYCOK13_25560 [Xylanibacillus composti]|uniref:S1 motif domain-containing protein n=2 Tax=Xylanibacillus composti TaxID=1572762 RepID=A0A8J4H564_9BACL|nr:hypothetical protein XYCOK13_25560 [Xylanibacillus composti]